ncbi:MAG: penicillin-binding protein 2 [Campylobacterales bacterium]|nr:penicillin-binding protein 2 [Campylobacterales bacterium]
MRIYLVIGFIVFIVLLLLARVFYLSVPNHLHYEKLAQENHIKRVYTTASRGSILDRNGKYLATNDIGFSISIKPHLRGAKEFAIVEQTAKLINTYFPQFEYEKLLKKYKQLDSPYKHEMVKLIEYIPYDDLFKHYTIFNSNEHIQIDSAINRVYLYKDVAAHILGYVGKTNTKDIIRDEQSKYFDKTGRTGLERYYDKLLRGNVGYEDIQVDALYKKINTLESVKPQSQDLQITIDIELQKYIHELFNDKAGAAIVMDIHTGEILAAGSFPEFDNNIFVNGVSHQMWKKIQEDFNHPFTNKLINGSYPPGSVMKMGTAVAFLENGIAPSFNVYCTGEMELGSRKFRCWNKKGHHTTGFIKAIRESCDDFFYKGSLEVGINKIHETLDRFGIGQSTGVDLPNESSGINPNKSWKQKNLNLPWYVGETVVASIGQGFITVTPMQIARYTGAMASNTLVTPHLKLDKELPVPIHTQIKLEHLKLIQKGMFQVANHPQGTASKYIKCKTKVAAKTGTAQVVGIPQEEKKRMKEHELEYFQRSHAWLTTYAPFENPQYVVTLLVEHGGHGGSAAGPIATKIYDKLVELGYIKE